MTKAVWTLPLIACVLLGCATVVKVPVASANDDAAAKTFSVRAGNANLYIAQSNGHTAAFDITIDGKKVGPIGPGFFYLIENVPGRHTIMVSSSLNSSKVTVDAEGGKNYFYEVTAMSSGIAATPSIRFVFIEEMGKLMVRQNKRALIEGE